MTKTYIGVNNVAQQAKSIYVGDSNGLAQKVLHAYVGDSNGIARLIYNNADLVSIPIMTSNTAPAGTCTASSEFSGSGGSNHRYAYMAFDRNDSTMWSNAKSDSSPYIIYDFGFSIVPTLMTIQTNGNAAANRVRFQGKPEGSSAYTTLATVDCNNSTAILEVPISTSTAYQAFRWQVLSFYSSGTYARIQEMNVFGYRY